MFAIVWALTFWRKKLSFYLLNSIEEFKPLKTNDPLTHCVKRVRIRCFPGRCFSCIRNQYGDLQNKSSHSVQMRENTDQKNTKYYIILSHYIIHNFILYYSHLSQQLAQDENQLTRAYLMWALVTNWVHQA